jgi:hypothetical protein
MVIKTDDEGKNAIIKLCDIALKSGGLANSQPVNLILASVEKLKEEKEDAKTKTSQLCEDVKN